MAVQQISRQFAQGANARVRLRLSRADGTPFDATAAAVKSQVRTAYGAAGEIVLQWAPTIYTTTISGTTWWILQLDASYTDTEAIPTNIELECDVELTVSGVRYRVVEFSSLKWTPQVTLS